MSSLKKNKTELHQTFTCILEEMRINEGLEKRTKLCDHFR